MPVSPLLNCRFASPTWGTGKLVAGPLIDGKGVPVALRVPAPMPTGPILTASGSIDLEVAVEPDDVPLPGLLAAMKGLAGGTIAGKVLIDPRLEDV